MRERAAAAGARSRGLRYRGPADAGSMTVELVVLVPVLVLLVSVTCVFARVTTARQQVVEAARAGATAAAVLPSAGTAQWSAAVDAAVGLAGAGRSCTDPQVDTDTSQFFPGGHVTVTVVCRVALSDVAVPGLPGSTTVRASATAPIDPYQVVG